MLRRASPNVVLLAGPNGAGKSTTAPLLLRGALGVTEFVNADVLARGLSAFAPERVAGTAGRIMLGRLRELAAQRVSFAFETTLASRSFAPWLRELMKDGCRFHLVFLWLPSADIAVARVAERVRLGGHDVPEEIIRRRYTAGLRNFFDLYQPLAATWRIYDNSDVAAPRLIAAGEGMAATRVVDRRTWEHIKRSVINASRET
ncbi:MAG: zeta toxin family protein [Planctomycetota bacterium]|nr:zeta toxin family protein [Planctomycetota bacterium]